MDADFSPDGSKVVTSAADQKARIWSMANPAQQPYVRDLRGEDNRENDETDDRDIPQVMFTPDSQQILATFLYRVELWSNDGQSEPDVLFAENGLLHAVGLSANGDRAFTFNSGDSTLRVYRASWRSLREGLRSYMKVCLPASRRIELLGEGSDEARNAYVQCEQAIHRTRGE